MCGPACPGAGPTRPTCPGGPGSALNADLAFAAPCDRDAFPYTFILCVYFWFPIAVLFSEAVKDP